MDVTEAKAIVIEFTKDAIREEKLTAKEGEVLINVISDL